MFENNWCMSKCHKIKLLNELIDAALQDHGGQPLIFRPAVGTYQTTVPHKARKTQNKTTKNIDYGQNSISFI